jgi:hypothetical protein
MSESEIFKAAIKLPPEKRAEFLAQACGDDLELRREVELLLQAHEKSESFLEPAALLPSPFGRAIAFGTGFAPGLTAFIGCQNGAEADENGECVGGRRSRCGRGRGTATAVGADDQAAAAVA